MSAPNKVYLRYNAVDDYLMLPVSSKPETDTIEYIRAQGLTAETDGNQGGWCNWTEDADGNWDTECGEKFCFISGGPRTNNMQFCCYCGGVLIENVKAEELTDEES